MASSAKEAAQKEGIFMGLNHKVLALTAILAIGMAMAGCGASGSGSSSAAASITPASSAAASSEAAEETGEVLPIAQGTLEDMKSDNYKFAADITAIKDGQVTMTVYSYDAYEKADIDDLKTGDVLQVHDQGDEKTVTKVTVNSIQKENENTSVIINGGVEQGGVELTQDHDVYRTVTFDDYPVYYKVGELTLPLADDASVSDTSADPQADAVISEGADAVEAAFNADPDHWICNNTTVFTEDGKVSGINRIWVP